ncbi:HAMP domain-containing sensor histidine kinase [Ferrovibrio terrae]|uniref:sensor histidine kinase n=1 Tax=Ferrovibrio terrae TaxID=2594003 RepID=UPI0031379AAE
MLDINTSVLLLTANMLLQAVGWLLIWVTQRRIYQVNLLAAGFAMYAGTMVMLVARDTMAAPAALIIIVHNIAIVLANALVVQGVASFLGQRGYPVLLMGCVMVTAILWPIFMAVDPDNVGIRVLVHNTLNTISAIILVRIMMLDRSQPAVLRWSMMVLMASEIAALTVRSIVTVRIMDTPGITFDATVQAWYFFFFNIFITAFFILLLIMVGHKLASDLRQRNVALQNEIAERRSLQEQLTSALEKENALHEEQKQLLRMVTHEFRTPLAIIDRAAEMIGMTQTATSDAVSTRIDSIRGAVQRLVKLTNRFLDSERDDGVVMAAERIDIGSLLQRVARHFSGLDTAGRLHISRSGPLPFYHGDPEMLTTVLINLVDNALKYSAPDSPVEIDAALENGEIVLAVRDRGIGIPAGELASVGRRFFRASNTTPATGTGIGLYNARRLLEYHQGRLAINARPDGGTIAEVSLPLRGASAVLLEAL